MNITFREVDKQFFPLYDSVEMHVDVRTVYQLQWVDGGLGGIRLEETPVPPVRKDLSQYERATEYEQHFDVSSWRFFMAFDGETPVAR